LGLALYEDEDYLAYLTYHFFYIGTEGKVGKESSLALNGVGGFTVWVSLKYCHGI
jgi:hypothetical protein